MAPDDITRPATAKFSNCPSSQVPSFDRPEGRNAFYTGEIAAKIVEYSDTHDGLLTLADFARI